MPLLSRFAPRFARERETSWSWFLVCCFTVIFGFRAYCIEKFGASIPWIDDWEATAQKILGPWQSGTLTWGALFEAHNGDHRIVATRLWEIFWYVVNGAWDPKLVMTAKAAVFATAAVIFIHLLVGGLERMRFFAGSILATLFAFPFSYHNLLWSFQSQFDFFLLTAALGWLAFLSGRRLLALLFAALAPFTLGAGPLVAASFLPFVAVELAAGRGARRQSMIFAVTAVLILALGILSRPGGMFPPGPPAEQADTFVMLLGWPHSNLLSVFYRLPETAHLFPAVLQGWALPFADWMRAHPFKAPTLNALVALGVLAPGFVLAWAMARGRIRFSAAQGVVGLGVLVLLLHAATAHARSGQTTIAIRYLDLTALAGLATIAAAFILLELRPACRSFVFLWAAFLAPAYLVTMAGSISQMKERRPQVWAKNIQHYFPSHDRTIFETMVAKDAGWPLPFRDPHLVGFMDLLDDPHVTAVLPPAITAPEQLLAKPAYLSALIGKAGLVLVLMGVGGGVWIVIRVRRERLQRPVGVVVTAMAAN